MAFLAAGSVGTSALCLLLGKLMSPAWPGVSSGVCH